VSLTFQSADSGTDILPSASDFAWTIETTLLRARLFLKANFGGPYWLVISSSITVALAVFADRLGVYRPVSKFGDAQRWLSRITFALIAATTFTMFVPTDAGSVIESNGEINAYLRQITDNLKSTSHLLAGRIVVAQIEELPETQRNSLQIFLTSAWQRSRTSRDPDNVFKKTVQLAITIDPDKISADKIDLSDSQQPVAYLKTLSDSGDPHRILNEVRDLETESSSVVDQERQKAVDSLAATLFAAAMPELHDAIGQFFDVLVETVADPLASSVSELLVSVSRSKRIKLLSRLPAAWIEPRSVDGLVQMEALTPPENNDLSAASIEDYATSTVAAAEDEERPPVVADYGWELRGEARPKGDELEPRPETRLRLREGFER